MSPDMPLVSVIIPFKEMTTSAISCLDSIASQSYPNLEIIAVHNGHNQELTELLEERQNITSLICQKGKSASRNFGASYASGDYLLHLDADMVITPSLVGRCIELARTGALAVIIPENNANDNESDRYIEKCFTLEKSLYEGDNDIESSRFFHRELFVKIGEFDERLDPIDEADIQAKLDELEIPRQRVSETIKIIQPRSLRADIKAKFLRGQASPLYNYRHLASTQLRLSKRARGALKHCRQAFSIDPIHAVGVVVIKCIETCAFILGSIAMSSQQRQHLRNMKNLRVFNRESKTYESSFYQDTLGARYVDTNEKDLVLHKLEEYGLLERYEVRLLDIGMGGGRWSRFLLSNNENADVIGLDFSNEMVTNAVKSLANFGDRFKAIVGSMEEMPFDDCFFDVAICFRSFKYVRNPEDTLKEISRVLKDNALLILEAPNPNGIAVIFAWASRIVGRRTDKGLTGYFSRITMIPPKKLLRMLERASLHVDSYCYLLAVPSTVLTKTNNLWMLKILKSFDRIASNRLFGRSIIIAARSLKKAKAASHE